MSRKCDHMQKLNSMNIFIDAIYVKIFTWCLSSMISSASSSNSVNFCRVCEASILSAIFKNCLLVPVSRPGQAFEHWKTHFAQRRQVCIIKQIVARKGTIFRLFSSCHVTGRYQGIEVDNYQAIFKEYC